MLDIGSLDDNASSAQAINDLGQVTGKSTYPGTMNLRQTAFIWDAENGMRDIGSLGNSGSSESIDINNSGLLVGRSHSPEFSATHAIMWTDESGMIDLGPFIPSPASSNAWGVNNIGQIVGSATIDGFSRGFLWQNPEDGLQTYGTLGGPTSRAEDINDHGIAVGTAGIAPGLIHAVIFEGPESEGGNIVDLGTLGGSESAARGMNNAGVVVGNSRILEDDSIKHAFVYEDGTMYDLNDLIWPHPFRNTLSDRLFQAEAINELGQIVGYTRNDDSQLTYGFLLDPIPEPLLGDTNGDGRVSLVDLNNVRNQFGNESSSGSPVFGEAYPFDGIVDIGDLNRVRNYFGATAETAAIPEPSTFTLATLMLLAVSAWRKRR